jgi:hypothetical protein
MCRYFLIKLPNIKFHENPFSAVPESSQMGGYKKKLVDEILQKYRSEDDTSNMDEFRYCRPVENPTEGFIL